MHNKTIVKEKELDSHESPFNTQKTISPFL